MLKHLKDTFIIIILFTILLLVLQQQCTGVKENTNGGDTSIVSNNYFYDSTSHTVYISKPIPGDSIPYAVPANVDTAAILQKFYTEFYYAQTVSDSNLIGVISGKVKENRLDTLAFTYKWLKPIHIQQYAIHKPSERKNKVFAGFHVGASLTGFKAFGPEAILITKKDHAYKINYNLIDNSVHAGTHWKLSFKKK